MSEQFVVLALDSTDAASGQARDRVRPAHRAHFDRHLSAGHLLFAAPLVDDDGTTVGSLMVTEFGSREGLDEWLAAEPYAAEGVWKRIDVFRCKAVEQLIRRQRESPGA